LGGIMFDFFDNSYYSATTSIISLVAIIVGFPAIVNEARARLKDRERRKLLEKHPNQDQAFYYVKSYYGKCILGENASELTKIREIRAFEDIRQITIDRAPSLVDEEDPISLKCFSMPGVAYRKNDYYQINLAPDQIFKANKDHTYLINYKLPLKLDELHSNPDKDHMLIERPLGDEKLVVEVHFPPTRKLKRVNKNVQLAVFEVRKGEGPKPIERPIEKSKYKINAEDSIQVRPGTFTDMFRLTLPHPPQDADYIKIEFEWSKVSAAKR
jgi:hypothetical protein